MLILAFVFFVLSGSVVRSTVAPSSAKRMARRELPQMVAEVGSEGEVDTRRIARRKMGASQNYGHANHHRANLHRALARKGGEVATKDAAKSEGVPVRNHSLKQPSQGSNAAQLIENGGNFTDWVGDVHKVGANVGTLGSLYEVLNGVNYWRCDNWHQSGEKYTQGDKNKNQVPDWANVGHTKYWTAGKQTGLTYNKERERMKGLFRIACDKQQCTELESAAVLFAAMLESDTMSSTDVEHKSTGGSSNWSPLNMNQGALLKHNATQPQIEALGQQAYEFAEGQVGDKIDNAVKWFVKGIRGGTDIGTACDWYNFHRGGETGWANCQAWNKDPSWKGNLCTCDCGQKVNGDNMSCKQFKEAVTDGISLIMFNPELRTNGVRVCEDVTPI